MKDLLLSTQTIETCADSQTRILRNTGQLGRRSSDWLNQRLPPVYRSVGRRGRADSPQRHHTTDGKCNQYWHLPPQVICGHRPRFFKEGRVRKDQTFSLTLWQSTQTLRRQGMSCSALATLINNISQASPPTNGLRHSSKKFTTLWKTELKTKTFQSRLLSLTRV